MNIVKSIQVEGFWFDKTVEVKFFDDVNFLIGVNGSGKTTLINLLSAVLRGDVETIYRIPFTKVLIQLKERPGRSQPQIEVTKEQVEKIGLPRVTYRIKSKKSEPAEEYPLVEYTADIRRLRNSAAHFGGGVRRAQPFISFDISSRIAEFIKVSWLSIHRANWSKRPGEEETYDSTVDQKVRDISDNFVKYFASLRSKADEEIKRFQEQVFLSLLSNPDAERNVRPVADLNAIAAQRLAIESIFKQFKVPEAQYRSRVGRHFEAVNRAPDSLSARDRPPKFSEVLALVDHERIHGIVQDWEKLQARLKRIFSPRDSFLAIINSLLARKQLLFDERDQALVETQSGKRFKPEALSSGEKQLFILLGEVVLQEGQPYVFVADEPELSLHVSWQSKLVQNLTQLNPNMQIVFATHSPDVVSVFQDRVIPLEEYID